MTFSEFIQLLFSVIGAGNNTSAFTRGVLDAIVNEDGSGILSGYKAPTYKAYFNGNTEITKLARKLNAYIDKTGFEGYFEPFSDDVMVNLCDSFAEFIPDINPINAGEKLADMLSSIITEAAKTNKKSTPKGAEKDDTEELDPDAPTALIFGSDGKAPDLGAFVDGEILYINCDPTNVGVKHDVFDRYMERASEFHSDVKTPLSANKPCSFYDIYVCNDLHIKTPGIKYPDNIICEATVSLLSQTSKFIIISGTGGIGKSMMMRHLFFSAVSDFEENGILPILLPLRKYDGNIKSIVNFAFQVISEFDSHLSKDQLESMLENRQCALLLDGLDEVASSVRSTFEDELEKIIKQYPGNMYVLSSRPTTTFQSFNRFTVLDIQPFSKKKALEMIDKLEYHDAEAKAKFREDLDKILYRTHAQFASNPLLLTIMLMTYTTNGNVPQKRHVFYSQAYETMARKHDAAKGSYVRPMNTELEPDEFAKYFAEFCARTYKDEVLEFTEQSFASYMDKVIAANGMKNSALTSRKFLLDITDNLCILYREGEKYYFIHRSFQEYFCALFFSVQMDDTLPKTAKLFENHHDRTYTDRTFDMLYDMIPDKIDRYIFLPYLTDLWEKCDNGMGYWTYLKEIYPVLYSQDGNTIEYNETSPDEFFYDFVVNENLLRYNGEIDKLIWPSCADTFKKQWVTIEETKTNAVGKLYKQTTMCEFDSVPDDYIEYNGEPEIEGESWEIEIWLLLEVKNKWHDDLRKYMEQDDFPLMKEYKAMRNYTENLRAKFESKPESPDDWFSEN